MILSVTYLSIRIVTYFNICTKTNNDNSLITALGHFMVTTIETMRSRSPHPTANTVKEHPTHLV
jgi:hypothetical protein